MMASGARPASAQRRSNQIRVPAPRWRHDGQVVVGENRVEWRRRRPVRTVVEPGRIDGAVPKPRQGVETAGDHEIDVPPRLDGFEQQRIVACGKTDAGIRRLQQPSQAVRERQFLSRQRRCEPGLRGREQCE
jgi:hypothetical protein